MNRTAPGQADEEQQFRAHLRSMTGGKTLADETAAIRNAKEGIPVVKEFYSVYPDASSIISHFAANNREETQWSSVTALHGRYELSMFFPVEFAGNEHEVAFAGEPTFHLQEVIEIEDDDGRLKVAYSPVSGFFGRDKWREIVEAEGKVEEVFEGIRTNAPVAGIEEYKRRVLNLE